MTPTRDDPYEELARRAEAGELRPIPGTILRGEAAAAEATALLMAATGAQTPEEAARLAVGRPRVGSPKRGPSKQINLRVDDDLYARTTALATREGVTVSEVGRRAMREHLDRKGA